MAKLNGANAVSVVVVKHVLENFDILAGEITVHLRTLRSITRSSAIAEKPRDAGL